ncbi:Leucine-rich repeat-containing protein 47 [Armadillidium vulgare]|nr:Leucine-rich repeat-containing protein 47 [Armadillidium vulgare]
MWPQVHEAKEENRHELLIVGKELNKNLSASNGILDSNIFSLSQLNFLRLASSNLDNIPEDIENLKNLTNLELQSNCLTSLPKSIGSLSKLKLLDVSDNKLESFPVEMNNLSMLTTITARNNMLNEVISFESAVHLSVIDLRMNKLKTVSNLFLDCRKSLTELLASGNEIDEISEDIKVLINLRVLNLSDNLIKEVPSGILNCSKLKELNLKGNPLSDRRFKKLVESDRGFIKQVLDYIKQHSNSKKSDSGKNKKTVDKTESPEIEDLCDRLNVLSPKENLIIKVSEDVKDVRGYLVCCVIRNLDLNGVKLKTFLSIQTKLHEGICEKRISATIATHDLGKINSPLHYCLREPEKILIQPLNKTEKVSAKEFYNGLKSEADAMRKQLKRNTTSGLHKYLSLVEGLEKWAVLTDSKGTVISFPPITNSYDTRIENNTSDVLVEVTSGTSMKKCKEVLEALVLAILNSDLAREKTENGKKILYVEQVRVLNEDENLRVVYPSRTDLTFDGKTKVLVVRH